MDSEHRLEAKPTRDATPRRSWLKLSRLARALRLVLVIYVTLCLASCVFQRKLLYFPDPSPVPVPANAGMEDVTLLASDGVELRGLYLPGERNITIVYFHGNAGNRGGGRMGWAQEQNRRGFGVFVLDYRGYGGSAGSPSEEGFYLDAEAAIDWLEMREPEKKRVYFGESIGTGVAVEMAVRRPPAGLVLQAAYTSIPDVARSVYSFARILPVGFLLSDRFASIEKIAKISCPSFHIHGSDDGIIPFELGSELYDMAPGPKELWRIEGGDHNDLIAITGEEYFERIDAFLRAHVEG